VVEDEKPETLHGEKLIAQIRESWDVWDLRDGVKDDQLEFDAFYNGFMAPYFGCYRCDTTRRALKAIDMDEDGQVDWNEFSLYLKWAIREYPETKDAEELLSIAFRKGLIPAMQDEVLK
jgi:Ca2+-binding EF-hand superfamily protein